MASCVNKNTEEFKALAEQSNINPILLAAKISLWQEKNGLDSFPTVEDLVASSGVNLSLKAIDILASQKAIDTFSKGQKNNWSLDKTLSELQVPKEQKQLILASGKTNVNDIIIDLLSNYSYAVEINISKETKKYQAPIDSDDVYTEIVQPTQYYSNLTVPGGTNYTENEIATPAITPSIKGHAQFATDKGIGWFRSDDMTIGGTLESFEAEYEGWGGLDSQNIKSEGSTGGTPIKTRRILEVQSDLFQKGRDKDNLISDKYDKRFEQEDSNKTEFELAKKEGRLLTSGGLSEVYYYKGYHYTFFNVKEGVYKKQKNSNQEDEKSNQFLQLLNQGSNWVTFFVKSIIQDSAKKGYEKVLFPSGDTASKVEGHTTLEEFKKQKEDRIKELEEKRNFTIEGSKFAVGGDLTPNVHSSKIKNKFKTRKEAEDFLNNSEAVGEEKLPTTWEIYDISDKIKNELEPINTEINQLKQELERVEGPEGFGALKPIYNFYENTVKNVLNKQYGKENVKQITDEYGNTWNEINIVPEREKQSILLQTKEMPGSKASKETLEILKVAAKEMGIDFQSLEDYAKANPAINVKGVTGLADLIKGVVAVAQGMENFATTEEIVHIATAIIEQTNPKLITQLISKIDRFKIYKQVLSTYGKRKEYQLADGRPDIRKIKKEAVDRLIAELIVYNSEGSTEFPELMEERNRSMIRQWWETILDYIRGVYGKTNIDIFKTTASQIATGNVGGTVADIKTKDVFFNISDDIKERIDNYYNTVMEYNDKLKLFPQTVEDNRHYTYEGVRVAKSVTEKVKEKFSRKFERTEAQKIEDDQKRDWGSEGHRYIEQYITKNLIDKDGYKRSQFGTEAISSTLSPALRVQLGTFAQELVNSYPVGTRFLIEKKVVNTKVKGMIASAVDFKAIYPVTKKDGTQGMKIDNLDWKFTTIDKNKDDDIPWYKTKEWVPQMGEYTQIDYNYGAKREEIGKARMIPFIVNYENSVKTDKTSPLIPVSLEIGKLNSLTETNMYLLPVPTLAESTGNPEVDQLISSLQTQYEKLFKKPGKPENEFARKQQLSQLSKAIRNLHVKLNFEPLYNVAKTFLENAKTTIAEFEKLNYANLDEAALKKGLKELLEYNRSAGKFASMDEVFLSQYPREGMTEENKKILAGLESVTKSTQRMQDRIIELLGIYTANLAVKQGIVSEENKMTVLNAETQISGFAKTWAEGTKLSAKIIKLASNYIMNASSMVNRETSKQIKIFGGLLIPLEESARAQGKKAFDLIGTMTPSGPKLIKKIDKAFLDDVDKALQDKNKKFLLDNLNLEKYNELAKKYIDTNLKVLDETRYSLDNEEDVRIREIKKAALRNSIDINRDKFNGYTNYEFIRMYKQTMIEEGHYSKEYQQMAKNQAALDMWNFLTALNQKGKDLGYLEDKGISFFPLIEATTLQKFGQTSNLLDETKDFFKGLYSTRINEEQNLSKIDPETGEVRKQIPKYFTKTDKSYDQLSTDLNKVGTLWIKALLDYESAVNMEDTLQAMVAVEKAKGSLIQDENGDVQFDSSNKPLTREENTNAAILETIVDDGLYKLEQDLNSIFNKGISSVTGKFSKTEEGKQNAAVNIKKALRNADTLTRALAVGLKPLIALANTFGTNFQSYVNAGGLYTFWKEYIPNELKISTNRLSLIEKGLLDLMIPLNEDIVTEERRKLARKQGLVKYLSTWSFSDVMMSTNAFPEKKLQLTNALSIIENSMVKDGNIVNIRQYLTAQDSKIKYQMSESERKQLEKTFEDRVKELKESSSLIKTAEIKNDEVVIPGVSEEELAKFRTKIIEYGRKLNGQMNQDNKAGYRRDAIFSSFMMFKTWIPKQVAERTTDVNYNVEVDNWEYGRTRVFFKTWSYLGLRNIGKMRAIINGTEEGLAILDQMLEEKRQDHFKKTGQELEITKEEFYDVMRKELTNQLKELKLLLILMAALFAAKAAEPPEDASDLEKNRYKFWAKALNKISDEVIFYYNPTSFEGMTKGSILPSLNLLTKTERVFIQLNKEFGDEPDKAYPQKALFNLIPGLAQFQTEILPFIDPELAKEWGIRVSAEARRQ